jgi:hypothetical protein
MSKHHDWKRFWCPLGSTLALADQGFLLDPDGEYAKHYNFGVTTLEHYDGAPCLVLLGEPGMGKSDCLNEFQARVAAALPNNGDHVFVCNLNRFSSDTLLVQSVFHHPTFQAWKAGETTLHLFLDSLDECLIRIETVATLLAAELGHLPLDRLRLRIACRTAVWPELLRSELQILYGDAAVRICELAPLRRQDVELAASDHGLDPAAFLREIARCELAPFAMKPVTLRFLIGSYKQRGGFPVGKVALYQDGCNTLVTEDSPSRLAAGRRGNLSHAQRLIIAGRVAAISVFCGYPVLHIGRNDGEPLPSGWLPLQDLIGGTENADGHVFPVTESAVRETLDTGLFTAAGPDCITFGHRTYAEFLAALYLKEHAVTEKQLLNLVMHSQDDAGRVVPQLQETAGWLASLVPGIFSFIVVRDPQILLCSDVATMGNESRAALVRALLDQFDQELLTDGDHGRRDRYHALQHPGLQDQLLPYIQGTGRNPIVRRVAIDIGEACNVVSLEHAYLKVALDQNDFHATRVQAAYAIKRIGSATAKQQLLPCVSGHAGADPDDELKGVALSALWPEFLNASVVFASLTAPKSPSLLGAYGMFLSDEIAEALTPSDLPVALAWVAKQRDHDERLSYFARLADRILKASWSALDDPSVLVAYVPVVIHRLEAYAAVPGLSLRTGGTPDDQRRRRILAEGVITFHHAHGGEPKSLVFSEHPLLYPVDIPWLLLWVLRESNQLLQDYLAKTIHDLYRDGDTEGLTLILPACASCPILHTVFAHMIDPVDLHSEFADKLRQDYQRWSQWQERRPRARELITPPPSVRVQKCLDRFEAGEIDAWWHLNLQMTLSTETALCDELEMDLFSLPGWNEATTITRGRIVNAARSYLRAKTPDPSSWVGTTTLHRPDLAGYRALLLLTSEDENFVTELSDDFWKQWAPVVLAVRPPRGTGSDDRQTALIHRAYASAPQQIIDTLMTLIDSENRQHGLIFVQSRVEDIDDERLLSAILSKIQSDRRLYWKTFEALLQFLVKAGSKAAIHYAASLVSTPPPSAPRARARAIVAARVLLTDAADGGWLRTWPAIHADVRFGRTLLSRVACLHDQSRSAALCGNLSCSQVADLYAWLVKQYPPSEDPQFEGAHCVGPREDMAHFRDAMIRGLQHRGTPDAVHALELLAAKLLEVPWLKWAIVESRRITLRQTWTPVEPGTLLAITSDLNARLIESADQLLDVVLESLHRLDQKLQAETPAAPDLWNKLLDGKYRPKDENDLSNYVARHLRDDIQKRGIVVNREVEIRRGEGDAKGERTDIHVDAVASGPTLSQRDIVSITVEVKGTWNQDLKTALVTQLKDEYLADTICCHGIYLVGWYDCPQWDKSDWRHTKSPKWSMEQAQTFFATQASDASDDSASIRSFVLTAALR